jgi:hypothetical protein
MPKKVFIFGSYSPITFFTDIFGMPSVAYSLRKLSPLSTNCVRVRRSSDNAEQNIGFVSNTADALIDTSALLSFVGAGNGFVTTWYDQSTNGRNSVNASSSQQPTIVSSGALININSKPSILFDGSDDALITSYTVTNVGDLSVQLVEKLNNITAASVSVTVSEAANKQLYMNYISGPASFNNYYANQFNITTANTNQLISSFYMGASGGGFYRNGTLAFSPTRVTNAGASNLTIGKYSGGGFNANGNFQELIVWDADKGSSRTTLESNINTYYNVF